MKESGFSRHFVWGKGGPGVTVRFGGVVALDDVSFDVEQGQIVGLIGPNGAGKTTLFNCLSRLYQPSEGEILFEGISVLATPRHLIADLGIGRTFTGLSVDENLRLAFHIRKDRAAAPRDMDLVFELFPRLKERIRQQAGTLSGGGQQMLAVGRALMLAPRLMLLDEPSFGLAPLVVQEIFRILRRINEEKKVSMLIVEQNAAMALELADHVYLLETGRAVTRGPSEMVKNDEALRKAHLGY